MSAPDRDRDKRADVTLGDVAAALGVSKATVSLAINADPRVAEATRRRVLATVEELGYIYNRGAAGLSTGRTNTVGLAVHDLANPYFTEVCAAIESVLSGRGRMAFLGNLNESRRRQHQFIEAIIEHRAEGLILCPAERTRRRDLEPLFTRRLATVLIARDIEDAGLDFVGSDGHLALKLVTGHLLCLGHERIAMIGGGQETATSKNRRSGYYAALREHGRAADETLVIDCRNEPREGEKAIEALLALSEPPTAVVCFADLIALGVLSSLHRAGRVPGRDLAVAGCDDIEEASRGYVQLTTARVDRRGIGATAARLLLDRIADPSLPPRSITLAPSLVVRKSCGAG